MNFCFLLHSLRSDWNHGNAHFVRGVCRDLLRRGHRVRILEPEGAWSLENLVRDHGPAAAEAYRDAYPELDSTTYDASFFDTGLLDDAHVVIVHEWTDPDVIAACGAWRRSPAGAEAALLFHDTHHRCVSAPEEMTRFDLAGYDAVLAFGGLIRDWYQAHHDRPAFTWHEACDPTVFHPRVGVKPERDLVWVGNWGDGERVAELHEFLIEPVKRLGLSATVHGVRYPDTALAALEDAGIHYGGYLPNHRVPGVFARHRLTVHVPRGFYRNDLPGIPTIRPFEALACGIPLVSAPWEDAEGLFDVGRDFLMVDDGETMTQTLRRLLDDPAERATLAEHGRATVLDRHTCTHRVDELIAVLRELEAGPVDDPLESPDAAASLPEEVSP